jgi:hypothetical protein
MEDPERVQREIEELFTQLARDPGGDADGAITVDNPNPNLAGAQDPPRFFTTTFAAPGG